VFHFNNLKDMSQIVKYTIFIIFLVVNYFNIPQNNVKVHNNKHVNQQFNLSKHFVRFSNEKIIFFGDEVNIIALNNTNMFLLTTSNAHVNLVNINTIINFSCVKHDCNQALIFGFSVWDNFMFQSSVLINGGALITANAMSLLHNCYRIIHFNIQKWLDQCLAEQKIQVEYLYGFNPLSQIDMMRLELCLQKNKNKKECFADNGISQEYTPMLDNIQMNFYGNQDVVWYDPNHVLKSKKSNVIPKILHQTWYGDYNKLGPVKKALAKKCREIHENAGWQYMLWTHDNITSLYQNELNMQLINQEWFDSETYVPNLLSDISRFEILYAYGGVFLDLDSECLKPFNILNDEATLKGYECYAGIEADWKNGQFSEFKYGLIASGTMGCVQHSQTMRAMIVGLFYTDKGNAPWISAGPYHFTKMIQQYNLPVQALPYYIFYPIHHQNALNPLDNESIVQINARSFAKHHWGTTFQSYNIR
jgi:hypothetical protein